MTEFRKMRRFKQQMTDQECYDVLNTERRGVLSVLGENGYPYGMPINFVFDQNANKIYFHGAKAGHKIDAIKKYDKVSFCVYDHGYAREGEWALNVKSVVIFGKISVVEDRDKVIKICSDLCRRFDQGDEYIEHELKIALPRVQCLQIDIEHMTGKHVNES